jgi:hypothetical protein
VLAAACVPKSDGRLALANSCSFDRLPRSPATSYAGGHATCLDQGMRRHAGGQLPAMWFCSGVGPARFVTMRTTELSISRSLAPRVSTCPLAPDVDRSTKPLSKNKLTGEISKRHKEP